MASAAGSSNMMVPIREKKTIPTDLYSPLRLYIASAYSEPQAVAAEGDLRTVSDLRAAVEKTSPSDLSNLKVRRDALLAYARALDRVEPRFPISPDLVHSLIFTWHDSFKGKKCALASIHFEKAAVLFNLGAIYSQIALTADRSTDVGISTACGAFESAAGAFAWLKECGVAAKAVAAGAKTVDVNPECAAMLEKLMLAQAQECYFEKVIAGGMPPELCSKVAWQAGIFYREAFEALSAPPLIQRTNKSLVPYVQLKAALFYADAYYRYSLDLHEKGRIPEEIAYLKIGMCASTDAKKAARRGVAPQLMDSFKKLESNMKTNLERALEENYGVYQQVPAAGSLVDLPAESLVKPSSVAEDLDASKERLFTSLIPDDNLKALSKYTQMVDNIIYTQTEKLQQAIQICNLSLDDMDLPDSIDFLKGNINYHSTLEKDLEAVLISGGPASLNSELQKLREFNQNLSVQTEELLQKEANEETQFHMRFGTHLTGPESSTRNKFIQDRLNLYAANLKKATDSDSLITQYMDKNYPLMSILDKRPIESTLPSIPRPIISFDGNEDAIVVGLNASLDELNSLKKEYVVLEDMLREMKRKDYILPKLVAAVGSHDDLFKEAIAKYDPICDKIADKIAAQEKILQQIQEQNEIFYAQFGLKDCKASRKKYEQITDAIVKYREVLKNINVGLNFYATLQERLDKVKQHCGDSLMIPGWIELHELVNITATVQDLFPRDTHCLGKAMALVKEYCERKIKLKSDELLGPVQKVRMRDPHVTIIVDGSCANPFKYKEKELRKVLADHDDPDDLLKEYVGDLTSLSPHPVLEGQTFAGTPSRWIHTRLELLGSTDSTTLLMRPDNVYTCGFFNERYAEAFCFELTEPVKSGERSKVLPEEYNAIPCDWDVKYRKLVGCSKEEGNAEVEKRLRAMVENPDFIPKALRILSSYIPNLSDDSEAQMMLAGIIFILCEMTRMNLRDMYDHLLSKVQNWGPICTKLHLWREGGYTEEAWEEIAEFLLPFGLRCPRDALQLIRLVLNRSFDHFVEQQKKKRNMTDKQGDGRKEDRKNLRGTNFTQIEKIGDGSKEHTAEDSKGVAVGRCRAQVLEIVASFPVSTVNIYDCHRGQMVYFASPQPKVGRGLVLTGPRRPIGADGPLSIEIYPLASTSDPNPIRAVWIPCGSTDNKDEALACVVDVDGGCDRRIEISYLFIPNTIEVEMKAVLLPKISSYWEGNGLLSGTIKAWAEEFGNHRVVLFNMSSLRVHRGQFNLPLQTTTVCLPYQIDFQLYVELDLVMQYSDQKKVSPFRNAPRIISNLNFNYGVQRLVEDLGDRHQIEVTVSLCPDPNGCSAGGLQGEDLVVSEQDKDAISVQDQLGMVVEQEATEYYTALETLEQCTNDGSKALKDGNIVEEERAVEQERALGTLDVAKDDASLKSQEEDVVVAQDQHKVVEQCTGDQLKTDTDDNAARGQDMVKQGETEYYTAVEAVEQCTNAGSRAVKDDTVVEEKEKAVEQTVAFGLLDVANAHMVQKTGKLLFSLTLELIRAQQSYTQSDMQFNHVLIGLTI